ncbi:30S ribosomal protein S4e [Candidatus Micrarchaeota archaeon]|nr:30S ribosomal protein S4e [Candidatus Micrarchaeota archaeon]
MAGHGRKRHFKRLAAPKLVSIGRKKARYLRAPFAGRHKKGEAFSLLVLLRDVLKLARDRGEAKRVLSGGMVLVDGAARRDEAFPVGLMDTVSIPEQGLHFRIVVANGKLSPAVISEKEAGVKLCKVVGKSLVRGGKIQLSFHDGRSHIIEREEDRFSLGDTVKLSIPGQKISGFIKLEKGARCYIHLGKHAGKLAKLDGLLERAGSTATDASLTADAGEKLITRKNYVFAVEDDFKL